MITVHGRTRQQMFTGKADWEAVAEVKEAVGIPVVVNGDITDVASARIAIAESGADGIMVGRGALGVPWILSEIQDAINQDDVPGGEVTPRQKASPSGATFTTFAARIQTARMHTDYMFEFYEPRTAVLMSRRMISYYLKWLPNASHYRRTRSSLNSRDEIDVLLDALPECESSIR
jgi:tRNA-dihydrouridine synthase B